MQGRKGFTFLPSSLSARRLRQAGIFRKHFFDAANSPLRPDYAPAG